MKDFLKIFFVLCGLVAAFVFGRNYGEKTITESKEYLKMRSDSSETEKSAAELAALKTKFQDLLDSSDLKKADEVLSKIMTVFLADLSLHLSEEKEKDLSIGKAQCVTKPVVAEKPIEKKQEPALVEQKKITAKDVRKKLWTQLDIKKYKSQEWLLQNARDDRSALGALEKVQIKSMNNYLSESSAVDSSRYKDFMGTYKGVIKDINGNTISSLSADFKYDRRGDEELLKFDISSIHNGKKSSRSGSYAKSFGNQIEGLDGIVIDFGKDNFLQFYKIQARQKIIGIFYERLANGTTNTIGTFILNRVDQF